MTDKPTTIEEYRKWLLDQHKVELSSATQRFYESATLRFKDSFFNCPFWQSLLSGKLRDFDERYQLDHDSYQLLLALNVPDLRIKPFDSFVEKSYRVNVLENRDWPDHPKKVFGRPGDWVLPDRWYLLNDIVRTRFTVKYFDGVAFLLSKLEEIAKSSGLQASRSYQSRDEGYYALHFYVELKFDTLQSDFSTKEVTAPIELQITTQLQDVIGRMIHEHYEKKRVEVRKGRDDAWKWDANSREFAVNYMGHILHYLEGMILNLRDKERRTDNGHQQPAGILRQAGYGGSTHSGG